MQQYGWTYKGKRGWRTAVIFNNNMRSAHMAGRWEQLLANSDRRPYLQYRTAGDSRVRPQHRAWNGLIYPIGDSFWQTHYPPNGWGCRCTIRAYSDGDLGQLGVKPSEPFEVKTRRVVSQDGEIKDQVPVGIDAGWDHNVGQSWIAPELSLGQKLARLPDYLRGPMVDKAVSPAFQKVLSERFKDFRTAAKTGQAGGAVAQVVGYLDSRTLAAVAANVPELVLDSVSVGIFDRQAMQLDGATKANIKAGLAWPENWINDLPENLRNYRAVLWDIKNQVLVVIPQGNFDKAALPKIVLRPNASTNVGASLAVESLGSAPAADLGGDNFQLLVGKL